MIADECLQDLYSAARYQRFRYGAPFTEAKRTWFAKNFLPICGC
jgi:hypothetical protein